MFLKRPLTICKKRIWHTVAATRLYEEMRVQKTTTVFANFTAIIPQESLFPLIRTIPILAYLASTFILIYEAVDTHISCVDLFVYL